MLVCALLGMLFHVCWQCFTLIILHIHLLVLDHPAFCRWLILCIDLCSEGLRAHQCFYSPTVRMLLPYLEKSKSILAGKMLF